MSQRLVQAGTRPQWIAANVKKKILQNTFRILNNSLVRVRKVCYDLCSIKKCLLNETY